MESAEYQAIVSCGLALQELIGYSYRSLTPSLRSSGLISRDTEERTRLNSTGSDIASNILGNVESSIKADPSLYFNFLETLDDPYYDRVKQDLESAREKHSRSQGKNCLFLYCSAISASNLGSLNHLMIYIFEVDVLAEPFL